MRAVFVLCFGVVALGGCSMTVAESIPKAHAAKTYVVHFTPAERAHPVFGTSPSLSLGVDAPGDRASANVRGTTVTLANIGSVGGAVTEALAAPSLLDTLRQYFTVALVVLGSLAVLNIAFVARVLRRRALGHGLAFAIPASHVEIADNATTDSISSGDSARLDADAMPDADAAIEQEDSGRRCSCNAPISRRSRTGRCRRCARNARTSVAPPQIAQPLTLSISAVDESDEVVLEPRAVLTSSRLGKHGEYYSVVG